MTCRLFMFAAITAITLYSVAQESGSAWRGAVAKADITPTEPMWMSGYASRKGPFESITRPIHVKLALLEDAEGTRLAVVTMDLIGVPRSFRDRIEALAEEKFDVRPECLLINASHTHSGPMIRVYEPPGGGKARASYSNIPVEEEELRIRQTREYNNRLVESVEGLFAETVSTLAPVDISWSHSRCGFAMNRRTPQAPGEWKNFPNPNAPVDHEVPVLQMRGKESGDLKAVLFGYACHATVMGGMDIHGDWPGYAQQYFEEDHPGTVALFVNGCSGDQNPYPRRFAPYLERHGRSMATAIEAALETESRPVEGPIRAALSWPAIPYQAPPTREQLIEKAKSEDKYDARHAEFLLEVLDREGSLPESYEVPVQVIGLGKDLLLAAIGGEVTVDYSLRLKRELKDIAKGTPVWVAGYSNDVMAYIPSKRVLLEGGYEGGGAMRYVRSTVHPAPWDPGIEETLVGKILEMTKEIRP